MGLIEESQEFYVDKRNYSSKDKYGMHLVRKYSDSRELEL
jgi:hypothetical protein